MLASKQKRVLNLFKSKKYAVKKNGDVVSMQGRTERVKSFNVSPTGYRQYHLSEGGGNIISVYGQVLAWLFFYGAYQEGNQIDHINRKKQDNRIVNLRCSTAQENHARRVYSSRKKKSSNAKLKPEQKEELITKWKTGNYSKNELARKYGVVRQTIYRILA